MNKTAIGYRPARGARPRRVRAASGLGDTMLRLTAETAGYKMLEIVSDQEDEHAAITVLMDLIVALNASAIFVDGGRAAFSNSRNRETLARQCQDVGVELFD